METSGYSKTPLAKKLGIKDGMKILIANEPIPYKDLFSDFPSGIIEPNQLLPESLDFIHVFIKTNLELETLVKKVKPYLKKSGILWVSWPKGTSKIKSNLKREPIRSHLLDVGLVDIKVCAVNDDWSGLKFMYRKKDR